jgi:hypothetical protein
MVIFNNVLADMITLNIENIKIWKEEVCKYGLDPT